MSLEPFKFSALADFDDGRIREAVDLELERARLDCIDRAAVGRGRTVTLKITMVPEADQAGHLVSVDVGFDIKLTVPQRESRNYSMTPGRGVLLFNESSPEDAAQMTIDEVGPRGAKKEAANAR